MFEGNTNLDSDRYKVYTLKTSIQLHFKYFKRVRIIKIILHELLRDRILYTLVLTYLVA